MSKHAPTPWNCATAYSSVFGVPIIAQSGQRVGNTALPDLPKELDEMKRRAVADAEFICLAVNSHEVLVKALERAMIDLNAAKIVIESHGNESACGISQTLEIIVAALSAVTTHRRSGGEVNARNVF